MTEPVRAGTHDSDCDCSCWWCFVAHAFWSAYICKLWSGEGWQVLLWWRFPPKLKWGLWPATGKIKIMRFVIIGPVEYRRFLGPSGEGGQG